MKVIDINTWKRKQQYDHFKDFHDAYFGVTIPFDVELAYRKAKKEGVSVLGINDFYTTDGYDEFAELAVKNKVFPLYNIEFMALQNDLQEAGVRVNVQGVMTSPG